MWLSGFNLFVPETPNLNKIWTIPNQLRCLTVCSLEKLARILNWPEFLYYCLLAGNSHTRMSVANRFYHLVISDIILFCRNYLWCRQVNRVVRMTIQTKWLWAKNCLLPVGHSNGNPSTGDAISSGGIRYWFISFSLVTSEWLETRESMRMTYQKPNSCFEWLTPHPASINYKRYANRKQSNHHQSSFSVGPRTTFIQSSSLTSLWKVSYEIQWICVYISSVCWPMVEEMDRSKGRHLCSQTPSKLNLSTFWGSPAEASDYLIVTPTKAANIITMCVFIKIWNATKIIVTTKSWRSNFE